MLWLGNKNNNFCNFIDKTKKEIIEILNPLGKIMRIIQEMTTLFPIRKINLLITATIWMLPWNGKYGLVWIWWRGI